MQAVHLLNINSPDFEMLKMRGIYCPYPGYRHHITIGEVSRKPYPLLDKSISLQEILGKNKLSEQINEAIFSSSVLPENHGAKLSSGLIHRWPFNKPNSLFEKKQEELRPNSYKP